jgi:hypothetical protein
MLAPAVYAVVVLRSVPVISPVRKKWRKRTMANHPRYHIVIDCRDDKTTAFMFVDGKCVKVTQAKRSPKDKFSLRIGAETAFKRLFEKKEKEE